MAVKSRWKPEPMASWEAEVPIKVVTPLRWIDLTGVITAAVPHAAISSNLFFSISENGTTLLSTAHPKLLANCTSDCLVTELRMEGLSGAQNTGLLLCSGEA